MTQEGTPRADGSAFCLAHRLRYDPQLNVGCVLCQRAFMPIQSTAPPARGLLGPVLGGVLLGAIGMFGLQLAPLLTSRPAPPPTSGAAQPHARALPARSEPQRPKLPVVPSDAELVARPFVGDPSIPPLPPDAPQAGLPGAAVRGDLAAIAERVAAHTSLDEQDAKGRSPLCWAILANRPDAARALIEAGARVDLATFEGRTPLMLAAERGFEAVTALLLERGAAAIEADAKGVTPLMLAACHDHAGVIDSLLAHHALLEARDDAGRSALMYTALCGATNATVNGLLAHGAALEGRDIDGATPLLLAASNGADRALGALLTRGAALTARDHHGFSALDRVVQPRPEADDRRKASLAGVLQLLIDHKVDPQLTIDPAHEDVLFRSVLDTWRARLGLEPLPPYGAAPAGSTTQAAATELDSPATVQLLGPKDLAREIPHEVVDDVLVAWHGWTRVPQVQTRVVVRGVALYGEQQATLVKEANGGGAWRLSDVLLLELMQNGQLVDIAFVGAYDGVEVHHEGVRRLGDQSFDHVPGNVDLTPWLSVDGRELVVTVLSGWRETEMSPLYLRVNGAGARGTISHAEVDRSGEGGTL